jgi:hypothetical protein
MVADAMIKVNKGPKPRRNLGGRVQIWPLLRRSEPAQSCQISGALCSGVGRCKLVFVDCAAQKGLLSIAQRRAIRLSLSTVSVSVGASRQGRCLVNMHFGTLNHYRAFFEKVRTHRSPRLSVSIWALSYWPKALPTGASLH